MTNRSRSVAQFLVAAALASCALLAAASAAQAERDLEQRFTANQRGNITMAANSLTTCSLVVSNCPQRRERAPATNLNNGAIQMQFNDVDGDPTTKSSAKAMLNLPAGAQVLFAGLYWGGRPELKPTGSEFNVTPTEFGEVKLAAPGGAGYQQIAAEAVDEIVFGNNGNQTWQGLADVTSVVAAAGVGEYMVGGVRVEAERITTNGTWGGWSLVVAYSDPSQPWRNLVVYDGLKRQLSGSSSTDIPIEGFRTPPAPAAVNSTVGVIAYEGDGSAVGDSANFVQDGVEVALEDALNPANNFFNSTISRGGIDFGDRTPNYSNNYSFDATLVDTVNALKNSTTEATLRVKTAGDGYGTGVVTMATELFTPKVTLSKTVENVTDPGATFAHPGDVLEYEIAAQNQTSTPADPVDGASSFVLGDAIPPGLNYVPGSLAVTAGPGAPASPTDAVGDDVGEYDAGEDEVLFRLGAGADGSSGGTIAPGEATTVSFRAEIDLSFPGGEIDNEAVAKYQGSTLVIPLEDSAEASLLSEPLADLKIEKSVSPELVSAVPSQVTYTLDVENKGPGESASTLLTDELPAGLEYVSDDAECDTSAPPLIECDLGAMAAGATATVQIVAEVPTTTTGTVLKNTARVEGPTPDLEPEDNESSATVEVEPLSDLEISKTTAATSVKPGEQLTYLLKAENKGPTMEPSVTVTDTLPPGLAYVSDDGDCNFASPAISCEIGSQAAGQSNTISVVTEVLARSGSIENTAEVSGSNPDPEPDNNESTAVTPVEPISDLAIEKSVSAPTARPGEQLTYTLEVENKGPSTSDPTTLIDTLPTGLTYASDDGGCEIEEQPELICGLGSMTSGASKTIHIVAEVAPSATGTLENTAVVIGPNEDPQPEDNEATATTTVEEIADLAIAKTASAPTVKPGEQLTYTLEVENKGPSTSDPTTVTDDLPSGLSYVSDDAECDTSAPPSISCEIGEMAAGASATIEIVTSVSASSGTIENTAKVEGPHPDPEPDDNEATATSSLAPLASDLTLSKSAPGRAVKTGDQITYTLVASNQGPDPSPQTVLTDTLPPSLSYVSDDAGCDTSDLPQIECELGALAEGESQTVQIVTKVTATDGQPIQNKARVSGANADPEPANNPDAAQVQLAPVADPPGSLSLPPASPSPASAPPRKQTKKKNKGKPRLRLTKTASAARARPGAVVAYRIRVANTGNAPARKVKVCDHPPAAQRTLRTAPKAKSKAKPCWRLRKLAPGAKRSFRLTAMVDPGSKRGAQRNRATVRAANVKGVRRDAAAVGVKPLPGAGCLAGASGSAWLPEIEFLC